MPRYSLCGADLDLLDTEHDLVAVSENFKYYRVSGSWWCRYHFGDSPLGDSRLMAKNTDWVYEWAAKHAMKITQLTEKQRTEFIQLWIQHIL